MLCGMSRFSPEEKTLASARIDEVRNKLLGNCRKLSCFPDGPVLLVGDIYPGIWLEHNQDNLFLADFAPETAWRAQELFMNCQREDGLLPFMAAVKPLDECFGIPDHSCIGYWHIQSIYPFARCALEIARKTRRTREDLPGKPGDDGFGASKRGAKSLFKLMGVKRINRDDELFAR